MGPDEFLLLPSDGLLLADDSSVVTFLDRGARMQLGPAASELEGARLDKAWPELWRAMRSFQKRGAGEGPVDLVVNRGGSKAPIRLFATDTGVGVGLLAPPAERQVARDGLMDIYRRILGSINDVVVVTLAEPIDRPGPIIVYANESLHRDTGYHPREVLGRTPRTFQGPGTNVGDRLRFHDALAHWSPLRIELLNHKKDGTPFWVEIDLLPIADDTGWYTHWFAIQRDVTERRKATSSLQTQALRDPLTGLPNRRALHDRLELLLDGQSRRPDPLSLLFCDLDDFKLVNDSLGHSAGDLLLVELASRMSGVMRSNDTLIRLGGDEFVVLCEGVRTAADAVMVAIRLQEAIAPAWRVADEVFHPQMSIGIALADRDDVTSDELLRRADVAMYQAKTAGRNRVEVYDPGADGQTQFAITLQHDLREAIDHDTLVLEYQPVVRLSDTTVVAAEALVRLVDRSGHLVPASQFVPLAEVSGLIAPLGDWVLGRALEDTRRWRESDLGIDIALNVSPAEVRTIDFAERFLARLEAKGIPPTSVIVEITETTLMQNPARKAAELTILRDAGVGVALDDFGVGYSSLAWLVDFPLTSVKIDKRHTAAMMEDERVRIVVRGLISVCRELGLSTVAEGIETPGQRDLLGEIGCQYGQGFLFSPSIAPSDGLWMRGVLSPRR